MVGINVAIPTGPNEVAHVHVALLRDHVGEQGVAGDVERHAQKDVGAALVKLAAEFGFLAGVLRWGHIKLKESMAGHQRHLGQLGHVPGAHDDAATVRVVLEGVHHLLDLVDVAATGGGPAAPLHAIHRAQVTVFACPFIPDGAAALLQPCHIAVAAQKPQQLHDDGFEEHLFGGHQGKALVQVKPHLVAKHALGAGAGAVAFLHARPVNMAHEVFVLAADGAGLGRGVHGVQV
mgnify:CR=1 FL=1